MFKYPDSELEERRELLNKEAIKKENRNYDRTLSKTEIDEERRRFSQDHIDMGILKEQAKNVAAESKAKIDNIEARTKERLEKIKTGKATINGILYGLPDYDNGRIMWHDSYGELIDSRDLLPEERQATLFRGNAGEQKDLDLPSETQGVVNAIVAEMNANRTEQDEHNEEAWSLMTDNDLFVKYGTSDISVVRTMVYSEKVGEWLTPKEAEEEAEEAKKNVFTPTPDVMKSTVDSSEDAQKTQEQAMAENAKKNKKKK